MDPRTAQTVDNRARRQGEFRAATEIEESFTQRTIEGGQDDRRLDIHRWDEYRSVLVVAKFCFLRTYGFPSFFLRYFSP